METRIALVTGAGRGIGFAIAAALAAAHVRVAIVDRDGAEAAAMRLGGGHAGFPCDISDAAALERLPAVIAGRMGKPPDILVHCAGIFPSQPVEQLTLEVWRAVFAVNVDAAMVLAKALAPSMARNGGGRMVMISSGTIGIVRRDVTAYVSSKMALIGLARALASDLGSQGITVNAVAPGFVLTEGTREKFVGDATALAASISAKQAIPRLGSPEEIAAAVAFLCSDDAGTITGQTWMVDGGWHRL